MELDCTRARCQLARSGVVAFRISKCFGNCKKVVDDVLLYDEDLQTHLQRTYDVLTRCREFGITLDKDKFVVAAPSVNFCGYTLSNQGITADHGKVSAIKDLQTPANITKLRSFMGLVN